MGTFGTRQLLLRLAERIVARIEPEELSLFAELADAYFENPAPPRFTVPPTDDPLASGLSTFLAPATPAALAMLREAFAYIEQVTGTTGGTPETQAHTLDAIVHDQLRRHELQQLAYRTALMYGVVGEGARHMTNALLTAFDEFAQEINSDRRVVNAWIADQPPDVALRLHAVYQLCFAAGLPRQEALAQIDGIDALASALPADQAMVEMIVLLESEDVAIQSENPQVLYIPRVGASETIQFAISPQRAGSCNLVALFFIAHQLFQKMEITCAVDDGAAADANSPGGVASVPLSIRTKGQTIEQAMVLQAPAHVINLIILKRENGYQLILETGGGVRRACIKISEIHIAECIAEARRVLANIVHKKVDQRAIYQLDDVRIPEEVHQQSLQQLAELGIDLYDTLFYNRQSEDARAIGDLLRTLMWTAQCHVRVIAERFIFPWALLYDRLERDAIDEEGFWGFRHLIACLPNESVLEPIQFQPVIEADSELHIGFIYDAAFDRNAPQGQEPVRRQSAFLQGLAGVVVKEYADRQSLFGVLSDSFGPHHMLYFYCHASSYIPGDSQFVGDLRGAAQTFVKVTDGKVTLIDMQRRARERLPPLARAPLVFMNACESAELSPYLYEGFVPYLIARGARGVLGTEADTPTFFAAAFAEDLFKRFVVEGEPLGAVLLAVRLVYLREHRNLLGLLYTLYGSNDLRVARTVAA